MSSIFISYRRADSGAVCGRITDSLRGIFGKDAVFRDVSDIPGGIDFRRSVNTALDQAKVVVALIGPTWASAADEAGRQRLANPDDPVRVEIELALDRRIQIIPVLVLGARMPAAQTLPPSIAQISFLNAHELHDDPLYQPDLERIAQAIAYFVPLLPTDQSRMQQQANAAYIQAQRFGQQAAPVVKTVATGAIILQISGAVFMTLIGLGISAIPALASPSISQYFISEPNPQAESVVNILLFVPLVAGFGIAIASFLWGSFLLVALIRGFRRRVL